MGGLEDPLLRFEHCLEQCYFQGRTVDVCSAKCEKHRVPTQTPTQSPTLAPVDPCATPCTICPCYSDATLKAIENPGAGECDSHGGDSNFFAQEMMSWACAGLCWGISHQGDTPHNCVFQTYSGGYSENKQEGISAAEEACCRELLSCNFGCANPN